LFQRHFSVFLLVGYSLFSLACLSWAADPLVRTFKQTFYYLMSPATVPLLSEMNDWGSFGQNTLRLLQLDRKYQELEAQWRKDQLDRKRLEELESENRRLTDLLHMQPHSEYTAIVAEILTRDSNDWFHSLLIARGEEDGVNVLDPVAALQNGREVLVGRVAEVYARTARVLLLTDPLSSVSAKVSRTSEHGAVEGEGSYRLKMNYLFSDSDVKPGDEVVTAGLGGVFPEGIFMGVVENVERESRESFKWARLKPAVRLSDLEEVFVLRREASSDEEMRRVRRLYTSTQERINKGPERPVSSAHRRK
jgi:rod shape-determining protein MreC